MQDQQISAHKVTKPIQLLAAWLVGLLAIDAGFLFTAVNMDKESLERTLLVIAAILNVPAFLWALFTLQTKFRAELQEDTFYSQYLSKKTSIPIKIDKNLEQDTRIDELNRQIAKIDEQLSIRGGEQRTQITQNDVLDWSRWDVGLNSARPDFKEIRAALQNARIPLAEIFGGEAPNVWVISISYSLPITHKVAILKTLLPFGFDGIQLWHPQREAEENEDVYIGSYGNSSYAQVTNELVDLLRADIEEVDLRFYCDQHRKFVEPALTQK